MRAVRPTSDTAGTCGSTPERRAVAGSGPGSPERQEGAHGASFDQSATTVELERLGPRAGADGSGLRLAGQPQDSESRVPAVSLRRLQPNPQQQLLGQGSTKSSRRRAGRDSRGRKLSNSSSGMEKELIAKFFEMRLHLNQRSMEMDLEVDASATGRLRETLAAQGGAHLPLVIP